MVLENRKVVDGNKLGEHVYVEEHGEFITIGLHTLNMTRVDSQWRDQILCTVEKVKLMRALNG